MRSMILLGYRDIFTSGSIDDKLELANKVGHEDIINIIGYFMGSIHKQGIPDAAELLKDWFTYLDHSYTQSVAYTTIEARIAVLQRLRPESRFTLISVEAVLRLFLWVRQQGTNINKLGSVKDASVTIDLFKLMLLFNMEVVANIGKGRLSAETIRDYLIPHRRVLTLGFSSNDFVNVDLPQIFACQVYKAAKLLEFMESTLKYQSLHKKILADFGCANNKEYIQAIGGIIAGTLSTEGGKTTIVIPDGWICNKKMDNLLSCLFDN